MNQRRLKLDWQRERALLTHKQKPRSLTPEQQELKRDWRATVRKLERLRAATGWLGRETRATGERVPGGGGGVGG